MSTLSAPKNLTRNVLIGMAAGVIIASAFYYGQHLIPSSIFSGVEKYIFNLGGQIFKNLLMLVVVPLVFFFYDSLCAVFRMIFGRQLE